jgi:hypothetical protein
MLVQDGVDNDGYKRSQECSRPYFGNQDDERTCLENCTVDELALQEICSVSK